MASRKSLYLFDEVEQILEKALPGVLLYSKAGRVRGKVSVSGMLRFMIVGFDEMIEAADHGLTKEEVAYASRANGRPNEEGQFPMNPILWANVVASKEPVPAGINKEQLGQKIRELSKAQEYKLVIEMVHYQYEEMAKDEE